MKTLETHLHELEIRVQENVLRHPRRWLVALSTLVGALLAYSFLFAAPAGFSPDTIVRIPYGTSTPAIITELAEAKVVAHPDFLWLLLRLSGKSDAVQTGSYRFSAPESVFTIAYRLVTGDYGIPPVRMTFIEGFTVASAAKQIAAAMPGITAEDFISAAASREGYLFPDTYFFPPSSSAADIANTMASNFDGKMLSREAAIRASGRSLADIVTMASIIEKEARTDTDRHLIAGILSHRLAIGMPLQVDAAPETYDHKGLPGMPICNPGEDAIDAALNPTPSNYLYYLTGRDGLMHYAATYAAHQANVRKYLN